MRDQAMQAEIDSLRRDMRRATDAILSAAQSGLSSVARLQPSDRAAANDLSDLFCAILEACTFEAQADQRLSNVERQLCDRAHPMNASTNGAHGAPALVAER